MPPVIGTSRIGPILSLAYVVRLGISLKTSRMGGLAYFLATGVDRRQLIGCQKRTKSYSKKFWAHAYGSVGPSFNENGHFESHPKSQFLKLEAFLRGGPPQRRNFEIRTPRAAFP